MPQSQCFQPSVATPHVPILNSECAASYEVAAAHRAARDPNSHTNSSELLRTRWHRLHPLPKRQLAHKNDNAACIMPHGGVIA
eukprot:5145552-Amphidinium_carterae.1